MKLIESTGIDLRGKHAVVIGRSNTVGKPMALMLLQADATVTVCHSAHARSRRAHAPGRRRRRRGRPAQHAHRRHGQAGRGRHRRRHEPQRRRQALRRRRLRRRRARSPAAITPVPGGVGPMTIAMLLANTVESADRAAAAAAAFRDVVTRDDSLEAGAFVGENGRSLSLSRRLACPRRARSQTRPPFRVAALTLALRAVRAARPGPVQGDRRRRQGHLHRPRARAPAKARWCRSATGRRRAAAAAEPELPFELRQVATKYPVTLYTTTGACEPCSSGRQLLKQRGIPVHERQVVTARGQRCARAPLGRARSADADASARRSCAATPPRPGTPYLDAAGYPRESRLPSTYQYRAGRAGRRSARAGDRARRRAARRTRANLPTATDAARRPRRHPLLTRTRGAAGASETPAAPRRPGAPRRCPQATAAPISQNSADAPSAAPARPNAQRHHGARQVDRHRAQGDRLAVACGRRDLVQRRHDHRLHRAEREAEDDGAAAHQPGRVRERIDGEHRAAQRASRRPAPGPSRSRWATNGIDQPHRRPPRSRRRRGRGRSPRR